MAMSQSASSAIIGNLRDKSFMELWRSHHAGEVRQSIACKECFCTNEIFMWSSIVYQPKELVKSMIGGRIRERPVPLREDERASYSKAAKSLDGTAQEATARQGGEGGGGARLSLVFWKVLGRA